MRAESIKIEGDEDGFHLIIRTVKPFGDRDTWDFNIHAVAPELFEQVKRQIGEWLAEGEAVRREYVVRDSKLTDRFDWNSRDGVTFDAGATKPYDQDEDAYDLIDPKHPRFHSVHADLWDTFREGK